MGLGNEHRWGVRMKRRIKGGVSFIRTKAAPRVTQGEPHNRTPMLGMLLVGAVIILLVIAMIGIVAFVYGSDMPAREWKQLLDRDDVLILDTETTGLSKAAQIVEIALLDTRGVVRINSLVMPAGRRRMGASRIHGLTYRQLVEGGARPWCAVAPEVATALQAANIVLAWNSDFDVRMLRQTDKRYGLSPTLPASLRVRCAMLDYHGDRISLVGAVMDEGVAEGTAHRALGDCQLVLAVMRAVVRRAHGSGS